MNEYGRIKTIALRGAKEAFVSDKVIADQWQALNYHSAPDFEKAVAEYDQFRRLVATTGAQIVDLAAMDRPQLDSIYVRDSLIVTPKGLVLAGMGKAQRRDEPWNNAQTLEAAGETVIGEITGPGQVEGGDLVWLDSQTLLAGVGYRTNDAGLDQLAGLLGAQTQIFRFDLPHYKGAGDVFHLMSVLSPVDADLAVVYPPLMPVRLVQFLQDRGIGFVEVPDEEFETMGCNVLALAPRHVIIVAPNRLTVARLQDAGCQVEVIRADEISRKGEGGPTCLTRPLARQKNRK